MTAPRLVAAAPAPDLLAVAARLAQRAEHGHVLRTEAARLIAHSRALRVEGDRLRVLLARCTGPTVPPPLAARVAELARAVRAFQRAVRTLRADMAELRHDTW